MIHHVVNKFAIDRNHCWVNLVDLITVAATSSSSNSNNTTTLGAKWNLNEFLWTTGWHLCSDCLVEKWLSLSRLNDVLLNGLSKQARTKGKKGAKPTLKEVVLSFTLESSRTQRQHHLLIKSSTSIVTNLLSNNRRIRMCRRRLRSGFAFPPYLR